jgi:hypothetical protein
LAGEFAADLKGYFDKGTPNFAPPRRQTADTFPTPHVMAEI